MLHQSLKRRYISLIRQFSNVKLDDDVSRKIDNEVFKPRRHPGRGLMNNVSVPDNVVNAIVNITEDYPIKSLLENSKVLVQHLISKLPPVESFELREIKKEVTREVMEKYENVEINEDEKDRFHQSVQVKIDNALSHKVYNWTACDYGVYNSLLYLIGRFAPEYAVLIKVLHEITIRDADFKPRSLFDFGSGVGTATWAAKHYWNKYLFEYFNVDSSADMNDLAQLLLQDGRGTKQINLKGIFYRQFLPATNIAYDLVISAYTLMELPSRRARLQTILNLWNKTLHYLVVVEHGTNAGFKIINEVRDFILNFKDSNEGYVFSPCPHNRPCPRFLTDVTPCNFHVSYMSLPIGQSSDSHKERYSYVVLKKGIRNESDPQWPRIVRPPLVRSKHTICRLCTKQGKLSEIIFTTSKHGKTTYYCARSSKWGDRLPIVDINEEKEDTLY
ncbi:hypothetical protein FQA39_LY08303 [Lamprigera yunnana]|nr:hypothetical protein FQA39_LY08303 [Lamprigera yunnana]